MGLMKVLKIANKLIETIKTKCSWNAITYHENLHRLRQS